MLGSAYRGRILISATLETNVPEPKLLCNGKLPTPPSNAEPPEGVQYCLRAFVLEGNGMPVCKETAGSWLFGTSGTGIEISMGEHRAQTKLVGTQEGRSCWYQELELKNMEFPDDGAFSCVFHAFLCVFMRFSRIFVLKLMDLIVTQLPDVFVNLVSGDDGQDRLSYYRIHAMADDGGLNGQDLHGLDDMLDINELPRARWYSLQRDVFGNLGTGHYPGSLLLCIGFGRMDNAPVRSRVVSRTSVRQPSMRMGGATLEQPNDNENESVLESNAAELSTREKVARLKDLAGKSQQLEASLASAKASVMQLNQQMQRHLSVKVIEARDLRDTETFGLIDPYVKLTLGGKDAPAGTCTVKQTRTLDGGGHEAPRWDQTLTFSDLAIDQDNLIVEVYDEDVGSDDHLGTVRLFAQELNGIFESMTNPIWLDLADEAGGNTGRCGEVCLQFDYTAPEADIAERYKEASKNLQVEQQQLRELKREERLLSAKDGGAEHKSLTPPEEEQYRLLVHVFQAKNLPPADGSGSADPYLIASIGGSTQETTRKRSTLHPHWYETLSFELNLPSRDHIEAGLAPELILQLFDHDMLTSDDFMGRCALSLRGVGPEMPTSPEWRPLQLLDRPELAGHLLVSLQLINKNTDLVQVPSDIRPKMRRCTVEMMLLGCRGLKQFNYITPMAPYVNIRLNGEATAADGGLLTKPAMLPSPEDPNYLEIVKISCFIPEDPVYSPTLNARVHDKRFSGLREPLLGSTTIKLNQYLPWVAKNREMIMKRHQLNAESVAPTTAQSADMDAFEAARKARMNKFRGESTGQALPPTISPVDEEQVSLLPPESELSVEELREELQRSSMPELRERAAGAGISEGEIEEARESEQPKADVISLILSRLRPGEEFCPEPEPEIQRSASSSFIEPEEASGDDQEDVPPWHEGRLIDGKILDNEWEDAMKKDKLKVTEDGALSLSSTFDDAIERAPFDTWTLNRHSQTAFDLVSGSVGSVAQYGALKGLIRIIDHSSQPPAAGLLGNQRPTSDQSPYGVSALLTMSQSSTNNRYTYSATAVRRQHRTKSSDFYKTANYLPWPIQLSSLLRPTAVVVRVYCIRGIGLHSMDSGNTADPFLEVKLGADVQESPVISETLEPYFGECFEFESTLPGPSKLEIVVKDHDYLSTNSEIGRTEIDLEDRFFDRQWQALRQKPLERRTLRLDGSKVNRGKVELWIDVMTKSEAATKPKIDISMPPPSIFELRMIIWQARNMPAMDMMTQSNDLFFSAHVATVDKDGRKPQELMQETDTHWRSSNGKGSFNWRCLFDIELPQHSRSPARLSIKGWDKDPMTFSSDLIGYTEINLNHTLFKEGLRKYNALQRREAEIDAMDRATLLRKIDLLGEVELGEKGTEKIKIKDGATEENLRQILRDFSEGEAGTIVRFPGKNAAKDDGLEESDETFGDLHRLKKAKKEFDKAMQNALRVGSDNTPRKWVKLRHPNTDDADRGEVEISIELLPKSLADRRKTGLGRTAPNAFPVLPEPEGRVELSIFSPLATFKALVGNKLYSQICSILFCMTFAMCCWFMVPLVGSEVVANVLIGD